MITTEVMPGKNSSLYYFVLIAVFVLGTSACSSEEDDVEKTPEVEVDLAIVAGRYLGTWDWEFGSSWISMELVKSGEDEYDVSFYESRNFMPGFNSDGVTPDALGIITISSTDAATIDLNLDTDRPLCIGEYTGSGTRNSIGRFRFNMDIVHDCAQDAPAVFVLTKVSN